MDVRQKRNKVLGERVVKALESRNMDAYYAETRKTAVEESTGVDSGRKYDQYGRCLFRTRMRSD